MKFSAWLKGCAALTVALCPVATPAAAIRLLQVQPAVIRETLTTRAANELSPDRSLRLGIRVGVLQHDILLAPNRQLGSWAQSLGTRAIAFEGELPGLAGSWARLTRTEEGWVGMWFDGQRHFAVDSAGALSDASVQAATMDRRAPLVFALADAVFEAGIFSGDMATREATGAEVLADPPMLSAVLPTRRLSVALIADPELVARDGAQTETNMLARLDIVDGIYASQVGVRISAGSVTLLSPMDSPFTSLAASTLLEQLRDYRSANAAQQAAGVSHLMTGRNLDTSTVGIAYLSSLCDRRFGASLSEARGSVNFDALIMAHELGHVFGAPHDGETDDDPPGSAACSAAPPGFLMATQLNGSGTFSSCSLERMQPQVAGAQCLAPIDAADASLGAPLSAPLAQDRLTTVDLTVRSEGNATVNAVQLQIDLPTTIGITAASAQVGGTTGGCTATGLRIVCDLGALAPGTVRPVQLSVLATVPGSGRANLLLTAANDGLASNNVAAVTLRVEPGSDLAVSITTNPASIAIGGALAATISVQNLGPADVGDALLTVTIPAGVTLESITPTGVACSQSLQTVTCTPGALAAGATGMLVLALRGAVAGSATLVASARASRVDPVASNDQAQQVLVITSPPPASPAGGSGGAGGGGGGGGASGALGLMALALWLQRRQRETPSK